MIKKIILLGFGLLPLLLYAQVTIHAQIPPAGFVQKDQLWNLVLVNNKEDILDVSIKMNLQDAASGQVILSATSGNFLLGEGVKLITPNSIQPLLYNNSVQELSGNYLPMGSYIACYQLISNSPKQEALGEECSRINIDPLSPPLLNTPVDKSELVNPYPQFTWMPPAPYDMFSNLSYDLVVTEVMPGQSSIEAVAYNTPIYTKGNILQPYESYSSSFSKLETGKLYAWQVVAKNGLSYAAKTEVWTFSIKKDSIDRIISLAPFIKMEGLASGVSIAYEGFLKMEMFNNSADSIAHFTVRNISKHQKGSQHEFKISLRVTPGQNFLVYDMKRHGKLNKNEVYEVTYTNGNNESFFMKFMPLYSR